MNLLDKITNEIAEKISKASINKTTKPTILFCGCNPQVKKDMHKLAKRLGLNPSYSIKHPTIKVELKNNRKIETDPYRTITIGYEHFEFICRYLESKKFG
tara:strand:- start:172 stop:471 length:300 start_codon:yes stop_codon:yes gene_type:complete